MRFDRWAQSSALALLITAGVTLSGPSALDGQQDSAVVVPGQRYGSRGALHEILLGRRYRELWTMPIRVPVLDLGTFAGGLTVVRRGGDQQTLSLRFRAADGREFDFRSVDKEVTHALPEYARETLVDWVFQDLTSAQLPTAPVVAAALMDAAGIPNPQPELYVLPDDPTLGVFRADFGGRLGTLEVHPDEGQNGEVQFAGSSRIEDTDDMLIDLNGGSSRRVDERAFLRARLLDALIGDFDRHAEQWRWADIDRDGNRWWIPVPEDRDYAFVDYDGLLPSLARQLIAPRLIRFKDRYPDLLALMDNSLELNRRLLAGLSRRDWDSVALSLQADVSDHAIRDAVHRMPSSHVERQGRQLIQTLIRRRDGLTELARNYYGFMAESVEIHASNQRDRASIVHGPSGELRVRVYADPYDSGSTPYYDRTFRWGETREVRIFLHGGDDQAMVTGGSGPMVVRIIGGEGEDVLEDHSAGRTIVYDPHGVDRVRRGPRTRVSRSDTTSLSDRRRLIPTATRDWGQDHSAFVPSLRWEPHAELVVGGGPSWTRYRFRHSPYAWRTRIHALVAPLHGRVGAELEARVYGEGSPRSLAVLAQASNLEATAFHGFGNDSPLRPTNRARLWHERYSLQATLRMPLPPAIDAELGVLARYTRPLPEASAPPGADTGHGSGALGQLGVRSRLRFHSSRSSPWRNRFRFDATGEAFPAVGGSHRAYARISTSMMIAQVVPGLRGVSIHARGGARTVLGTYPFFDASFLGGWDTLRGYSHQRFAGDHAVSGGAEVRVPLTRMELLVRGDLGVSVFRDGGRVVYEGGSAGGWHNSQGGTLWFSTPLGEIVAGYAKGEQHRWYLRLEPGTNSR